MSSKNIEVGKRIKERREELGLTQGELGDRLKLNKSTIQRYESGKIATIKLPILYAMAEQLKVNPSWLALQTDDKGRFEQNTEPSNITLLPQNKIRLIPIYESVSAGFGAYADNYITGYNPCYIMNDDEARNTLCITVQGDSMYPKIENGDLVQVLRQDWADNGQIAVVLIDGESGLVKKFEQDQDSITLISINPEYPPKVFEGSDRARVKVLGIVRKIIKSI